MFRRTYLALTAATLMAGSAFADGHGAKMDIVDTAVKAGSFCTFGGGFIIGDDTCKLVGPQGTWHFVVFLAFGGVDLVAFNFDCRGRNGQLATMEIAM